MYVPRILFHQPFSDRTRKVVQVSVPVDRPCENTYDLELHSIGSVSEDGEGKQSLEWKSWYEISGREVKVCSGEM